MGKELDSNFYDQVFENGGSGKLYYQDYIDTPWYQVWSYILESIKSDSNIKNLLDIGCGPGQFAQQAKETLPYLKYTGIDFSKVAIAQAKNRIPSFSFITADALEFDYDTVTYDAVVTTEFLEHISADVEILSKIKKDTLIFATFPNMDSEGHVRFYSKDYSIAYDQITSRYSKIADILRIISFPYLKNPTNGDYLAILRRK